MSTLGFNFLLALILLCEVHCVVARRVHGAGKGRGNLLIGSKPPRRAGVWSLYMRE